MLLKKLNKQNRKALAKIKAVDVYLGEKKAKTFFHRLHKGAFTVTVTYNHKKKKPFKFNVLKMVDRKTGKTIQVRRRPTVSIAKNNKITIEWQVQSNVESS